MNRNVAAGYLLHVKCMFFFQVKSHNSVFESQELLLLLLPGLKVSVDQRLQLIQVLVLAFLLDVLYEANRKWQLLTDRTEVVGSKPTNVYPAFESETVIRQGKR